MSVKRMWLFNCGWLAMDESLAMYLGRFGQKRRVPVSAALVDTDDGYVLFDTGLNPAALEDPVATLGAKADVVVEFDAGHDIRTLLQQVGLEPNDVRWVVNSHLHWDHTGGNAHFPAATMILQEAEFRFAHAPDPFVRSVYLAQQYDLERDYQLINGEHVLCPGVGIIDTRGHSPGHQSLIVNLPHTGRVICSGDSLYCQENLTQRWPPGNPWSMPDAYRSISKLSFMQDYFGATVLIGHDPGQWNGSDERVRVLT